ncbi:MAG: LuxR C-terminal-related transcriptional regulator [Aeromicrobium sp.]|uniref:helix-turn-helix transcriptional regulator n=1 Tax=Aeromicrobium sp. TaxID=1871063 RepID=UPI0039E61880
MLDAVICLVTGRYEESVTVIDRLDDGWGERVAAAAIILRACVLSRRGQTAASASTLRQAEAYSDHALGNMLGLVPAEDIAALAALDERFARLGATVQRVGMASSGQLISGPMPQVRLTEKERLVLDGLRQGKNTRAIADEMYLSVNTVRTHVRAITRKLEVTGQADAVRRAEELGLFDHPRRSGR